MKILSMDEMVNRHVFITEKKLSKLEEKRNLFPENSEKYKYYQQEVLTLRWYLANLENYYCSRPLN